MDCCELVKLGWVEEEEPLWTELVRVVCPVSCCDFMDELVKFENIYGPVEGAVFCLNEKLLLNC